MGLFKKDKYFVSRFWRNFKFYRKYKGGTWYLIEVGIGPSVDIPFRFWDRNPPSLSKEYHETLISKEEYPND